MRVIGSVEAGGVQYQAIWASLSWINDNPAAGSAKALTVRAADGRNETIIARNAKLAEVENSLRHLRSLGLKDSQLSQLFKCKGKSELSQQVKVLASSLR